MFPGHIWEKYGHLWESKRRYDVDEKETLKPGPLIAYPRTDEALRVEALRAAVTAHKGGTGKPENVRETAQIFYEFLKGGNDGGTSKN